MVQSESRQPAKGPARQPQATDDRPTPKAFTIIIYAINLLLIFGPLGGMLYFMFDPNAFDTFLNWMVKWF
jgi:hypothetical protein